MVFGELAFFLDEQRHRIGAGAGERALELGGAVLGLLLDERTQPSLGLGEMRIDLLAVDERVAQRNRGCCGEQAARETAGRDGEFARVRVAEREEEPRADRGSELERGQRDQRKAREKAQARRRVRKRRHRLRRRRRCRRRSSAALPQW